MSTILSPGTEITDERIVIPCTFTAPPMRSNDRDIWQVADKKKRAIREEARIRGLSLRTLAARTGWTIPITEPVDIVMWWTVREHRVRDADAGQPTLKAFIDGLRRGGLLHDDRHEIVHRAWCEIQFLPPDTTREQSCRIEITRTAP